MRALLAVLAPLSLLLSGAIFGFFYAWVCSTMWGLDQLAPETAIAAMQGMNASVRNAVFAPAFFGTPFVLLLTGFVAWRTGAARAGAAFGIGGVIYLIGGMILTVSVNVPMNEALALVDPNTAEAGEIWRAYSERWQVWNIARTVVSGVTLLCVGAGIWTLARGSRAVG